MKIQIRIRAVARKNIPDLKALVLGRYPSFVYGKRPRPERDSIPAFIFHQVGTDDFEKKLIYLKENEYQTIDCSEFTECLQRGGDGHAKKVLLTFDDGRISLWKHAYPLLKEYGFKAVSFICPGLVPNEEQLGSAKGERRLCSWNEIKTMHTSGHVEFQAHSLHHDLVFTSPKLIDLLGAGFESHYMGKRDRIVVLDNDEGVSLTNLWPYEGGAAIDSRGYPIFEHRPKFATDRRFKLSEELMKHIRAFVEENGGSSSFEKIHWKKRLEKILLGLSDKALGEYVAGEAYKKEIAEDLKSTKEIMEQKLPGSKIAHFCPPWFQATETALMAAFECGYASAFLGPGAFPRNHGAEQSNMVIKVPRLSAKYVSRLPRKARNTGTPRL